MFELIGGEEVNSELWALGVGSSKFEVAKMEEIRICVGGTKRA